MTGIGCNNAKDCMFYKAVYGTDNFNKPVISRGKPYTCDAINEFLKGLGEKNRLSKRSSNSLEGTFIECEVLGNINKEFGFKSPAPIHISAVAIMSKRTKKQKIHTYKK